MNDIVKNRVNNITFQFPLKGDDFKELNLKALTIKKWLDENGQELAEFIYCHRNHYALNGYQDVHLKDIPSLVSKVDIVFREPVKVVDDSLDDVNKIRNHLIPLILSKTLDIYKIYLKLGIFLIYGGK
ncbi:MAG: hypothetical protein EHV01_005975 [Spiroplasma sp. hy2]|uniref:hypothetical protein n=1 Tax=Spiroplasma sp. hy2 TaxID=2490850 RepID=UPI003841D9B3